MRVIKVKSCFGDCWYGHKHVDGSLVCNHSARWKRIGPVDAIPDWCPLEKQPHSDDDVVVRRAQLISDCYVRYTESVRAYFAARTEENFAKANAAAEIGNKYIERLRKLMGEQ